jgi:S-sulfo-L-cysteine synthase (3-phospho-L-serine-dependent)
MESRKVVLFVEPSFYGVSFVKEAKKLNCKVVVLVSSQESPKTYGYEGLYDDLIVCDIKDPDSIYQAIHASPYFEKFDALIPATDYASANVSKVAEKLSVKGVPYKAALCARNKNIARDVYAKHNVPSAKYAVVKTIDDAIIAAENIGYPLVLKPTNAASSQNVFFIKNKDDLAHYFKIITAFKISYMNFKVNEEYLLEEYLTGPEFSVEIFVDNGNTAFSEVTEKQTSLLPYFVETMHVFPTSIANEYKDQIIKVAKSALDAIGFDNGPAHVEVKLTQEGPKIIEVNGRPGGDNITSDLIINAYGVNIFKETVLKYLDEPLGLKKQVDQASAIAFICAEKDGVVNSIDGLNILKTHPNITRYDISVAIKDTVKVPKSSDDRLGFVIVTGDTPQKAKQFASEIISQIKLDIK